MPEDQPRYTRSRQRPVSCRFCRTRKLRCSRTAPCSSCVSRGIPCDLPVERAVPQPSNASSAPIATGNSEIIERLHRLESLLVAQKGEQQRQSGQPPEVVEAQAQPFPSVIIPPEVERVDVDSDVAWLGSGIVDQTPLTRLPRGQIIFRTCPIGQVVKAQPHVYVYQHDIDFVTNFRLTRCIWLPQRHEASVLLDKFIRVAHHLPNVYHIASLRDIVESVYSDFYERRRIQSGQIVLLLSIFAAATHFWVERDSISGLFSSHAQANNQTALWIKATEDILNVANRSPILSIEGVQGAIVLGSVAVHHHGLHIYRVHFDRAVAAARNLGLHRIDHPSNIELANTAQAEVGRRVWWYLCASDWAIASRVGWMAEGIYSCHPGQMITRRPLNVNDDQVVDGMSRDERPLSQPTTMSYSIQRVRLGELSRNIVDRNPLAMAHANGLSHDAIKDIDTELQTLINDIPVFYSVSRPVLMETYGLNQEQAAIAVFQGRTVYFLFYSQRCKLHLTYLAQSSSNPSYNSSREICIKYARLIIESELWQEDSSPAGEMRFKFTELLTSVFLACVVLLLDLCVNPSSSQSEKEREVVLRSFKIMEEAKGHSEMTSKVVDSLIHLLRKYSEQPQDSISSQQQSEAVSHTTEIALDIPGDLTFGDDGNMSHDHFRTSDTYDYAMEFQGPLSEAEDDNDLSLFWTDFTQSFREGNDLAADSVDWDRLFSELDSNFI